MTVSFTVGEAKLFECDALKVSVDWCVSVLLRERARSLAVPVTVTVGCPLDTDREGERMSDKVMLVEIVMVAVGDVLLLSELFCECRRLSVALLSVVHDEVLLGPNRVGDLDELGPDFDDVKVDVGCPRVPLLVALGPVCEIDGESDRVRAAVSPDSVTSIVLV